MEPEPQEIWDAWQKWDDGFLYENGRARGINECVRILKDVEALPELNKMPSSFVVALIIASLEETLKENDGAA
tara:strand:+ start:339 stop:557 length:219 start_codon:yes stop_codon:yes gene_type:complete